MGSTLEPIQSEDYSKDKVPPLVDSQREQLNIGQIVVIAAYHTKSEEPPNAVAMAVLFELQQPNTITEQYGNTLFIAHESKVPKHFVFRALNADTAQNYLENAKLFIRRMQEAGAVELATQFNDAKLLKFIKLVAQEMLQEDSAPIGYREYKNQNGEYLVAITLTGVEQ